MRYGHLEFRPFVQAKGTGSRQSIPHTTGWELKRVMSLALESLRRWIHRRRRALRLLILVAIASLFVDGIMVERSFAHLMLLHPVLLVALLGALTLTWSPDE
jgi:hypothetical protein